MPALVLPSNPSNGSIFQPFDNRQYVFKDGAFRTSANTTTTDTGINTLLPGVLDVAGANYNVTSIQLGFLVRMTSASASTVTVTAANTADFPIKGVITIRRAGAGSVTIVAGSGVTINTAETLVLRKQGSAIQLIKVGENVWDLFGDVEAAA